MSELEIQKNKIIKHFSDEGGAIWSGDTIPDPTIGFGHIRVHYVPKEGNRDTYEVTITSPAQNIGRKDDVAIENLAANFIGIVEEIGAK